MNKAIDKDIYAPEALEIAKSIIDRDNKINIIRKGNKIFISTDDDILFKRFMNEALHQDLRLSLTKKNFNIIRLITTKAIASAIGKENKEKKPTKVIRRNNKRRDKR